MEYKMIVRRTLFDFDLSEDNRLKLRSVHFLDDAAMRRHNDLLLVTEDETIRFFLDSATPVTRLSPEQFRFISAAARYFGPMPGRDELPFWLWAGSLELPENSAAPCSRDRRNRELCC